MILTGLKILLSPLFKYRDDIPTENKFDTSNSPCICHDLANKINESDKKSQFVPNYSKNGWNIENNTKKYKTRIMQACST